MDADAVAVHTVGRKELLSARRVVRLPHLR